MPYVGSRLLLALLYLSARLTTACRPYPSARTTTVYIHTNRVYPSARTTLSIPPLAQSCPSAYTTAFIQLPALPCASLCRRRPTIVAFIVIVRHQSVALYCASSPPHTRPRARIQSFSGCLECAAKFLLAFTSAVASETRGRHDGLRTTVYAVSTCA